MPEYIHTDDAPTFDADEVPLSQATVHDDTVYVSGQVGIDPETGEMVDGGVEAEARQALENAEAILDAAGSSLDDVVKATVFLNDVDDFETVNQVYGEFLPEPYPARSAFEVGDLAASLAVEIEVIAEA
ncbi:RidA family protein [Haloparvum sp. PAK95]|uniref:RidA family protein n=1 Tax=Haloparvum sp. PAK95 TaxID=3418962 RepID=UPI003D2ED741